MGQLWVKASMPASVTLPHRSKYIVVNDVQFFATASTLTSVTMPQLLKTTFVTDGQLLDKACRICSTLHS